VNYSIIVLQSEGFGLNSKS